MKNLQDTLNDVIATLDKSMDILKIAVNTPFADADDSVWEDLLN